MAQKIKSASGKRSDGDYNVWVLIFFFLYAFASVLGLEETWLERAMQMRGACLAVSKFSVYFVLFCVFLFSSDIFSFSFFCRG